MVNEIIKNVFICNENEIHDSLRKEKSSTVFRVRRKGKEEHVEKGQEQNNVWPLLPRTVLR